MFGGYSEWSEGTAIAVLELRENEWGYERICLQLRNAGHTVYKADISHWRQARGKGFEIIGTEFGEIINTVEAGLCDKYNDDIVDQAWNALKDPDINPAAFRNWMQAMIHRVNYRHMGGAMRLPNADTGDIEVVRYRVPYSEAMGDKPEDVEG